MHGVIVHFYYWESLLSFLCVACSVSWMGGGGGGGGSGGEGRKEGYLNLRCGEILNLVVAELMIMVLFIYLQSQFNSANPAT